MVLIFLTDNHKDEFKLWSLVLMFGFDAVAQRLCHTVCPYRELILKFQRQQVLN